MPTQIVDKNTGELIEGNNKFFQFYKHNFKLIRMITKEYSQAAEVFLFIVENMDNCNALVISQKALCEALNLGRTTVHRCIEYLKQKKALAIYKTGNTNVYAINADIVWQKRHGEKVFAKFEAKVYLSRAEQPEDAPIIERDLLGHVIVRQNVKEAEKRFKDKKNKD